MARVAINGFGRVGRLALRAGWGLPGLDFVHVNEIAGSEVSSSHLLNFDSSHGRWDLTATPIEGGIQIGDAAIGFTQAKDPADVDWQAMGVDVVLECTGAHKTMDSLREYLDRGVGKVVVAAPVKDERALNVVVGVNDAAYAADRHDVVTAASCTTNCLAPIVKVLHADLGISHGSITTMHDMTNTQVIADAHHKDLRRARSASQSLIPTSTGSASAIGMIFPDLAGRLDGIAIRVPLLNASLTDCVFEVRTATTVDEVNALLQTAADGDLAGILGYEDLPLVSADYRHDPRSSIVDALSTRVTGGTQVKVLAWYDNEWGYANRMVELTQLVAVSIGER